MPFTAPLVDGSFAAVNPVGADSVPLAMKIIAHAAALARGFGADLHVLHAWRPKAEALLRPKLPTEEFARYVEATCEHSREALALLVRESALDLPLSRVHFLMGDAVEAITMAVQGLNIDTLVMGTVAGDLRERQLIGSVAEELLSRVDCGVLCVKPDGFETPIQLDSEAAA